MAVDEAARHELFSSLERSIGTESTSTLMSMLPPSGWGDVARIEDLRALESTMRGEMSQLRADLRVEMESLRAEVRTQIATLAGRDELGRVDDRLSSDFRQLREEFAELRREFGELRDDFGDLRGEFGELRGEFGELRGEFGELRGEFGELRGDLSRDMAAMEVRLTTAMRQQLFALLGAMITISGLTVVAAGVVG